MWGHWPYLQVALPDGGSHSWQRGYMYVYSGMSIILQTRSMDRDRIVAHAASKYQVANQPFLQLRCLCVAANQVGLVRGQHGRLRLYYVPNGAHPSKN